MKIYRASTSANKSEIRISKEIPRTEINAETDDAGV